MFCNPKYPLIQKKSGGKNITDFEPLHINYGFDSKQKKINYVPRVVRKTVKPTEAD